MKTLSSLIIFLFIQSASSYAECLPPASGSALQQEANWYVVDGDTLHFPNRKKLRLAMINAPELGRDGRPDQPYAQAAKLAAEVFLADGSLSWQAGKEAKDRYGRWLGSVFNQQGEWLGAHLVSQGLAYAISVGDNAAPECLWRLEAHARRQQLGLWDSALGHELYSHKIRPNQAGFMLLQGKVENIAEARGHWYVDLQGEVTLKINQAMWRDLGGVDPHAWLGQQVRVRGWLSWRKLSRKQRQKGFKPARMSLQHPHMLTVVN
jgi:endonuclease YncB( thermonuclease family)